jgi:hypothetical protein
VIVSISHSILMRYENLRSRSMLVSGMSIVEGILNIFLMSPNVCPLSIWLSLSWPVESGFGTRSQSQLGLPHHFRALDGLFVTFWGSRIECLQMDTAIFLFFFFLLQFRSLSESLLSFFS